jgi:acetyl esterase/lipase
MQRAVGLLPARARRARGASGVRVAISLLALALMISVALPASVLAARAPAKPPANTLPEAERIAYGPRWAQHADVYPSTKPNSPIVVLVHGGGWRKQTGLYFLKKESTTLQARGLTVFNVNYRQVVAGPAFPMEPEDIMLATRYAIEHAREYNGDPGRVSYVGGSAGANVAELAAEKLDEAAPGTVRAVVALSGPTNFETLVAMVKNHTITNENFVISIFMAMGGSEDKAFEPAAWDSIPRSLEREGSPALNVPKHGCPSWLLFSSEQDLVPLSQSRELQSALTAAHCRSTLQVLPGTGHGFAYWNDVAETVASFVAGP